MKEIFKGGASLFGRLIIINIMCFFLAISFSVLCTAAFTQVIGYTAYGTLKDSKESVQLYEHYTSDGEDLKRAEYEAQGYTITESKIRSQVSPVGNRVYLAATQICCLVMLVSFIYPGFWQMGTKDSNLVHFKHKPEDKLKGLKCGLIAIIPSVLLLLFLTVTSKGISSSFPTVLYKFIHSSLYSFIQLAVSGSATFGELSVGAILLLFLLLLAVPLISCAAYLLGYKNISLGEKFIYKKNKK